MVGTHRVKFPYVTEVFLCNLWAIFFKIENEIVVFWGFLVDF